MMSAKRKSKMQDKKSIYICGPLTELPEERQRPIREFYEQLADIAEKVTGKRAFVPHEHYDPIQHASYTPREVDAGERKQVCENTSLLLVVAIAPSWGGGIEVEMANQNHIPVIILCEQEKLEHRKISRLLRGNPAVMQVIFYTSENDALSKLEQALKAYIPKVYA